MKDLSVYIKESCIKESCINEKLKLGDINKEKLGMQEKWYHSSQITYEDLCEGCIIELCNNDQDNRYILVNKNIALELFKADGIDLKGSYSDYLFVHKDANRFRTKTEYTFIDAADYKDNYPQETTYRRYYRISRIYLREKIYDNITDLKEDLKKLYKGNLIK